MVFICAICTVFSDLYNRKPVTYKKARLTVVPADSPILRHLGSQHVPMNIDNSELRNNKQMEFGVI